MALYHGRTFGAGWLPLRVIETVETPKAVVEGAMSELLAYREIEPGKYLVVVYRESAPNDGFVITAFLTRQIRRRLEQRERIWPSPICKTSSIWRHNWQASHTRPSGLVVFCLYGCFSKPPDVVVSNGGWLPTFRRACGPVAPQFSAVPGPGQSLGLERRTDPAIWLLSPPNFDLAFATFAANTTYWVLLKQPDKQKLAS